MLFLVTVFCLANAFALSDQVASVQSPDNGISQAHNPNWSVSIEPIFGLHSKSVTVVEIPSNGNVSSSKFVSATLHSSFEVSSLTVSYDTTRGSTITFAEPYIWRQQSLDVNGLKAAACSQGFGDATATFEQQFFVTRLLPWICKADLQVAMPTGNSTGELPLGTGYYVVSSDLAMQKVLDPIAVMGSIGLSYTLPKRVDSLWTSSGLGGSITTGIGYALTDRIVLSEELEYLRSTNIFVLDGNSLSSHVDQGYITQSISFNNDRHNVFRLAFSIGMNSNSNDCIADLTWKLQ